MPKKMISVSAKLDEGEQNLLKRALRILIWFEQDQIVQFAKGHIYVPDENGAPKKFSGTFDELTAYFDAHPEHGKLHTITNLERLKKEVEALQEKLLPSPGVPTTLVPRRKVQP